MKIKMKMNSNKVKLGKVILASGLILALGCKNGNGKPTPPTVIKHTLSITKPTGGTITSNPGDINCGGESTACKASFNKGTKVTLTAQADAEYSPGDWQGACDEANADQPCKLVMDADKTAGKAFFPTFILSSSAFMEGGLLPIASGRSDGFEGTSCTHATGDPQNHSPQLSWKNAPSQTRSFVLIMSDLKAPDYAHWILWNIPTSTQTLAEDISAGTLPTSSQQAGAGGDVYTGPCPSTDELGNYEFRLYALSIDSLPADTNDYAKIKAALSKGGDSAEHVLAEARLGVGFQFSMLLSSSAFTEGGVIPDDYGARNDNPACSSGKTSSAGNSPPLSWNNAPDAAQSLVLIMSDTASPSVGHWVVWDIPTTASSLVENAHFNTRDQPLPMGSKQYGKAPGQPGGEYYFGPCPVRGAGPSNYEFRLYALKIANLPAGTNTYAKIKAALSKGGAHENEIISTASLTGSYEYPAEVEWDTILFTSRNGNDGTHGEACATPASGAMNESPFVFWLDPPAGTRSLVLIMSDTTNSSAVHWAVWNIPSDTTTLDADDSNTGLPVGASQDGGATGDEYLGPCVGTGMSKIYEFKLYALDIATLPADTDTYAEVKAALESGGASHGNVLGTASLSRI